ncbi:LEAF RUST 10 DISEASE-RESISTANCE LOCUS RECEPTOR-LIKE PROTEIN KINASE-like 1.2 [Hordeum vulgare subsp. vulgare]|uniref:LEAF RUST 10 DISEASE-RESISTANCE LOCUS RECEPTOR-LIKE PROTEIN KINASE-like 1.2 n=1 Tax=Hordeum vulgare subsp. vulgare TaxID=112509 RepID=UPI001D1A59EA|nr:LEAF RUST 10 DISEASE-RESISTANCE LOCUS RECEPTOR-LIKE PROTEIN KINASE-like 1.2 [Hordeum vulgare subsp. vulgare]
MSTQAAPARRCKLPPSSSVKTMPMPLLLPLAFLFLRTVTPTGSNGSCTPRSCGDLTIRYPFSLAGAQPFYCGYPPFDLTCDTSTGHAGAYVRKTFREHLFRINDISYENNSMVAAVQTSFVGDRACPVPDFNVSASLALFPFNISVANKRLVFFYNCTVPREFSLPRRCANHSMGAYISGSWDDGEGGTPPQGVPRNCSSVSVPVHRGMARPHEHYERLIRDGFLLKLLAPIGDCDGCRQMSGRECRFDQFAFQCACPDGNLCSNSTQETNATAHPDEWQMKFLKTVIELIDHHNLAVFSSVSITLSAPRNALTNGSIISRGLAVMMHLLPNERNTRHPSGCSSRV